MGFISQYSTNSCSAYHLLFEILPTAQNERRAMDLIPYLPKEEQELLLAGPALAPPAGIVANFENPPNGNGIAHATFVICLFFATFSFLVRMYARLVGLRSVRVEDGK